MADNKTVTVFGRLSFPSFTAKEAYENSLRGQYPAADEGSAAPNFMLVLADDQWQKVKAFALETFLPYCADQEQKGEKKDALSVKEVKALADGLEDLENQTYNTPFKPVSDKTLALAPEAVAVVKCIGPKGGVIEQKAYVGAEDELVLPDAGDIKFPALYPISKTNHELYPGSYCGATLNLYAYHNGKHPGFSAGVSTIVFRADAERFGGGVTVDESAFLD